MTNLKANNGIYLKITALFTAEQKAKLQSLDLNSTDKAILAAKVLQGATGDKIENIIDLIFGQGAYQNNQAEINQLLSA